MKKFLAVFLPAVLVLVFSACSNELLDRASSEIKDELGLTNGTSSEFIPTGDAPAANPDDSVNSDAGYAVSTDAATANFINRDRAIDLALNHAGLTRAEVRDLEAELDYEPNGTFWEVDFEAKGLEYSYDINAVTEEIRKVEKERD